MSEKNDLSPPIGQLNKLSTKASQMFSKRSLVGAYTTNSMSGGITTNSIGFGHYKGQVVGVALEPTDVDPNSITIAGIDISISSDFIPTSVPYGYVVNVPELKGSLIEIPSPNSSNYRNMLHSLIQAGFLVRVRPSQSAELAFVGDQVEVAFTNHGPPHSGGQYVGNISTASGMSIGPVQQSPRSAHSTGRTHVPKVSTAESVVTQTTDAIEDLTGIDLF